MTIIVDAALETREGREWGKWRVVNIRPAFEDDFILDLDDMSVPQAANDHSFNSIIVVPAEADA